MNNQERAALRRKIAEDQGWRVEIEDCLTPLHGGGVKPAFVLYNPAGDAIDHRIILSIDAATIDNGWAWALNRKLRFKAPDVYIPDWTDSTDDALTLLPDDRSIQTERFIMSGSGRWYCSISGVSGYGDTLPESICSAWMNVRTIEKAGQA